MKLPKDFKNLINEIEKLPGIGPKSALRLALYLVESKDANPYALASALVSAKNNIKYCKFCGALSDDDVCDICRSYDRDKTKICVVENIIDMLAIERANFFDGLYHILGGVISPLDDVTEDNIRIRELIARLDKVKEIIFSLPSSLEADATFLVLKDQIHQYNSNIKLTRVAIGLPVGANIDYADPLTLIRSFENRSNF
ncbi:MAG: recombination protein RecR [Candidatus Dojkabacteria bacterium]|nr:MAG: recombination protein RecR [Candidatus Dojkabacteria bacterium]